MDYKKKKCAYQPLVLKFTACSLVHFQCVQNEVNKSVEGYMNFEERFDVLSWRQKVAGLLNELEALKSGLNLALWVVHSAILRHRIHDRAEK